MYMTTRPTINDPWGTPVRLGPTINPGIEHDSAHPSISEDGLLLYFNRFLSATVVELWATTRASVTDSWRPPVNMASMGLNGVTPTFFGDGSMMYLSSMEPGGNGKPDLFQAPMLPVVDFSDDGLIDLVDLTMLIDNWGTDDTLYDIGPMPWGDGVVDIEDLKVFIEHWEN
jgi:hypothetical protein